MKTYISILRGINVSGQKLIKMDDLRMLYEKLGFRNVTTYIQSGNVLFSGELRDLDELEHQISKQIENDYGFEVPVIVLTVDKLSEIVANNLFLTDQEKDSSFMHVSFLSSAPVNYDQESIERKKQSGEEVIFCDACIYLYCPNGYGRTKLTNNFFESKLKVAVTTRNWKTTTELLKIASQIDV